MAARKLEIAHMAHIMLPLDSAGLEEGVVLRLEEGPAMKLREQCGGQAWAQWKRRDQAAEHPVFQPVPNLWRQRRGMVMEKQWDLHRPLHANLTFVPAKQSGFVYDG